MENNDNSRYKYLYADHRHEHDIERDMEEKYRKMRDMERRYDREHDLNDNNVSYRLKKEDTFSYFNNNTLTFMQYFNTKIKDYIPDVNKPIEQLLHLPIVFDTYTNKNFIVDNLNSLSFIVNKEKDKYNIWNVAPKEEEKYNSKYHRAVYFFHNKYIESTHLYKNNLSCINYYTPEQFEKAKDIIKKYNTICIKYIRNNLILYYNHNNINKLSTKDNVDYNALYKNYIDDMAGKISKYNTKEIANVISYLVHVNIGSTSYKPLYDEKEVFKSRAMSMPISIEDYYRCISVARRLVNENFLYEHEKYNKRSLIDFETINNNYSSITNNVTNDISSNIKGKDNINGKQKERNIQY